MNNKFQIAFTSVAFNNTYDDVYRFDSRAEQESFFEVTRLFQNAPYINILLSDFINMTITYKLVGQTIFDLEKYNYCILRETITENDVTSYKYYYYFISSMTYDSGNQFVIRLECDVIQTYYLGCTFAPCLINRAHLSRWKEPVNNRVTFNNAPDSKMLIPDNAGSYSKYSVQRTRLVLPQRFTTDPIIDWLNKNVEAWVYIYLYRSGEENGQWIDRTYNTINAQGSSLSAGFKRIEYDDGSGAYRSQEIYFSALCYPIYKKGVTKKIICEFNETLSNIHSTTIIDNTAEEKFTELNNDTSYYISKQVSRIPPFTTFGVENTDYEIDNSGNLVIKQDLLGMDPNYVTTSLGCMYVNTELTEHSGNNYTLKGLLYPTKLWTQIGLVPEDFNGFLNTFNISDIVGADFNPTLNPKIMSNAFIELVVSNEAGSTFTYDLQKMDEGINDIRFIYSEYCAPSGATRGYLRLASSVVDYGVYKEPAEANLTGLSFSQDMNLNYVNNQLAEYFSNNRNWQTQIGMRIAQSSVNQIMNMLSDVAMTFVGGKAGGKTSGQIGSKVGTQSAQGSFGIVQNITNSIFDYEQIKMSLDNMRGAPDIMSNANGNIMFNSTYSDIGLYLEIFTCIDTEAMRECQRMNLYGYAYKMLDDVKNCDNIRKYFNYISATPNTIVYYDGSSYVGLPTSVVYQIKAILNRGLRFWNVAKTGVFLDYTKENYELELEV